MPAPTAQQLEGIASGALQSAGIRGQDAPGLAKALAQSTAQALSLFLSQAQVLPGIPAAAPPPPGSGSTAGPGLLLPPPAGGPGATQLESPALAALNGQALRGKNAGDLAKVVSASLAQAIMLFTAQVQIAPGIAIAGLATTSPGSFLTPPPGKAQLQPLADGFMQQNGLRGQDAPALAGAIAEVIAQALTLFAAQVKVAPGIACSPGASVAPGSLL